MSIERMARAAEVEIMLEAIARPRTISPGYDQETIAEVRELGKRIGFGAMMDLASAIWRIDLEVDGIAGGEFTVGPCQKTVENVLARYRAALSALLPLDDEVVEAAARIIAPGHWQAMDGYLADVTRKYARQAAAYDPEHFKHKESMATARAAITAYLNAIMENVK